MDSLNFKIQKQKSGYLRHRWGTADAAQQEQETSLLTKKDLQIKRLQSQLENERKRADNALKMLDSFRNSHKIQLESTSNTQSEVSKRLRAEEQARRLKTENEKLRFLLSQHIDALAQFQREIQGHPN